MQVSAAHGAQLLHLRHRLILPAIISGAEIIAIVLSLPTTGPMLLKALQSQDMYLAGSFLMFLAFLTVVGVLISDLALALLDPRIRLPGRQHEMNDVAARSPLPAPGSRRCRITCRPRRSIRAAIETLTPDAGARLPRLAVAADVVEVPPPPGGGDIAASSCACSTPRS